MRCSLDRFLKLSFQALLPGQIEQNSFYANILCECQGSVLIDTSFLTLFEDYYFIKE